MSRLWYLACPYSDADPAVRHQRFEQVNAFAARLMHAGVFIFSPISHTHPIANYGLPKGWDFWEMYDSCILEKCCGLIVCQFDGWDKSVDVQAEIKIAQELGLEIYYVCPQDEDEAEGFVQRRASDTEYDAYKDALFADEVAR